MRNIKSSLNVPSDNLMKMLQIRKLLMLLYFQVREIEKYSPSCNMADKSTKSQATQEQILNNLHAKYFSCKIAGRLFHLFQ